MDLLTFRENLLRLSADDIRRCAAALAIEDRTVADEVVCWRAEFAIDRLVRCGCTRAEAQHAAVAAHETARLVTDVARRRGMALPDGDVTRVARSAAHIARGLVVSAAGPFVQILLRRFQGAMDSAAPPVLSAA
jgi:hypothetical protein